MVKFQVTLPLKMVMTDSQRYTPFQHCKGTVVDRICINKNTKFLRGTHL